MPSVLASGPMEMTGEPALRRRLAEIGIGGLLALVYWGAVLAMFLVALVFILIVMGPGIILVWVIACFAAWGFGILLLLVAGGLQFVPRLRQAALGFVTVSAAANGVLAIGLVVALVARLIGSAD